LTIENLYGIFVAGESLTGYSDENLTSASGASATLNTVSRQSLAESYPDIVRAAEMQVYYNWRHKSDFELMSTSRDGTNRRIDSDAGYGSPFIPEVMRILNKYKRPVL
jgi:hypothetical protein